MRSLKIRIYTVLITAVAALLAMAYYVRPLGTVQSTAEDIEYYTLDVSSEGDLPGITWADDIHPIFTRNVCIRCHTRGKEAIAEGFMEFALGLVDPEDRSNAYWSYHELVYAEGPPRIQQGEINRDGQCCWPRGFPEAQQRRIWIGRAERSAIVRKLQRDYYDWRNPPRFFEEGLELSWGLPMPMYWKAPEGEAQESPYYAIRPFYERLLLHIRLWMGGARDELHSWPSRIPARDAALLSYWISNSMQVMRDGTGIKVAVVDISGGPVEDAVVQLIGNYNTVQKKAVADRMAIQTDSGGEASISFPEHSVLTAIWYVAAEKDGAATEFKPVLLREGQTEHVRIEMPAPRGK